MFRMAFGHSLFIPHQAKSTEIFVWWGTMFLPYVIPKSSARENAQPSEDFIFFALQKEIVIFRQTKILYTKETAVLF